MGKVDEGARSAEYLGDLNTVLYSGTLRFQEMKRMFRSLDKETIIEYLQFLVRNEKEDYLNQISYYLHMFLDFPEVQAVINDPGFPISILEGMILEAYCNQTDSEKIDDFFDNTWEFLTSEKTLYLLLKSPFISQDILISLNLMINLESAQFDEYLARKEDAEKFLLRIVSCIPRERISHIFLNFPVFYGYIYFILKSKDTPEATGILEKFKDQIDDAQVADQIINNLYMNQVSKNRSSDLEIKSGLLFQLRHMDQRKLIAIRDQLLEVSEPTRIISLLHSRNVFQANLEIEVLKQMLENKTPAREAQSLAAG